MKQDYTLDELQTEMTALAQLFDSVTLADPRMGLLDPATLQPLNKVAAMPALDAAGRVEDRKGRRRSAHRHCPGHYGGGHALRAAAGDAAAPQPAGRRRGGCLHPRAEPDAG